MITKKSASVLSTVLLVSLLTGCSKAGDKATNSTEKKDATAVSTGSTDGKTETTAATSPSATDTTKTADAKDTTAGAPTTTTTPDGNVHINLNELPADMVICTVSNSPIKIGDYRRMLKLQQAQLQQQITTDPMLQANLLQLAKQKGITLTADEKSKLIATAKAGHGANFDSFLKQNNLTEAQFNSKVEELGVEFKAANAGIEETLLPQLISRELMASASSSRRKDAETNFNKFKSTPQYTTVKNTSGLSDSDLRDELVKGEMAKFQIEKLSQSVRVTDKEIKDFYNANKSKLMHDERVRLSSILMVAPEKDAGPIQSVRTQLKAAKPKLTDKELDTATTNFMNAQQSKALIILGQAKAGTNFVKLANDNTQDVNSKKLSNGGDMGWKDKKQLDAVSPAFATAVWGLKPGAVLDQLVKDVEGFRVVKVTGHEKKGPMALSEVRDIIAAKIKQDKTNRAVQTWVAQQQGKTKIEFSKSFVAMASGSKAKTN